MESLIVHPKNQMELNALKGVLKDMGIKFEKFHTMTAASKKQSKITDKDTKFDKAVSQRKPSSEK